MPSFLNAAELERVETGGAEIVVRAIKNLFRKNISKFLTPSVVVPISTFMRISAVITTGMLMSGKTNLVYPTQLKSTKGLST